MEDSKSDVESEDSEKDENYCYKCQGDVGHLIDNCPNMRCLQCDQFGHIQNNCRSIFCQHCKIWNSGHATDTCPNLAIESKSDLSPADVNRSQDSELDEKEGEELYCDICQEETHVAIDCPLQTCLNCQKRGHIKIACPELKAAPSIDTESRIKIRSDLFLSSSSTTQTAAPLVGVATNTLNEAIDLINQGEEVTSTLPITSTIMPQQKPAKKVKKKLPKKQAKKQEAPIVAKSDDTSSDVSLSSVESSKRPITKSKLKPVRKASSTGPREKQRSPLPKGTSNAFDQQNPGEELKHLERNLSSGECSRSPSGKRAQIRTEKRSSTSAFPKSRSRSPTTSGVRLRYKSRSPKSSSYPRSRSKSPTTSRAWLRSRSRSPKSRTKSPTSSRDCPLQRTRAWPRSRSRQRYAVKGHHHRYRSRSRSWSSERTRGQDSVRSPTFGRQSSLRRSRTPPSAERDKSYGPKSRSRSPSHPNNTVGKRMNHEDHLKFMKEMVNPGAQCHQNLMPLLGTQPSLMPYPPPMAQPLMTLGSQHHVPMPAAATRLPLLIPTHSSNVSQKLAHHSNCGPPSSESTPRSSPVNETLTGEQQEKIDKLGHLWDMSFLKTSISHTDTLISSYLRLKFIPACWSKSNVIDFLKTCELIQGETVISVEMRNEEKCNIAEVRLVSKTAAFIAKQKIELSIIKPVTMTVVFHPKEFIPNELNLKNYYHNIKVKQAGVVSHFRAVPVMCATICIDLRFGQFIENLSITLENKTLLYSGNTGSAHEFLAAVALILQENLTTTSPQNIAEKVVIYCETYDKMALFMQWAKKHNDEAFKIFEAIVIGVSLVENVEAIIKKIPIQGNLSVIHRSAAIEDEMKLRHKTLHGLTFKSLEDVFAMPSAQILPCFVNIFVSSTFTELNVMLNDNPKTFVLSDTNLTCMKTIMRYHSIDKHTLKSHASNDILHWYSVKEGLKQFFKYLEDMVDSFGSSRLILCTSSHWLVTAFLMKICSENNLDMSKAFIGAVDVYSLVTELKKKDLVVSGAQITLNWPLGYLAEEYGCDTNVPPIKLLSNLFSALGVSSSEDFSKHSRGFDEIFSGTPEKSSKLNQLSSKLLMPFGHEAFKVKLVWPNSCPISDILLIPTTDELVPMKLSLKEETTYLEVVNVGNQLVTEIPSTPFLLPQAAVSNIVQLMESAQNHHEKDAFLDSTLGISVRKQLNAHINLNPAPCNGGQRVAPEINTSEYINLDPNFYTFYYLSSRLFLCENDVVGCQIYLLNIFEDNAESNLHATYLIPSVSLNMKCVTSKNTIEELLQEEISAQLSNFFADKRVVIISFRAYDEMTFLLKSAPTIKDSIHLVADLQWFLKQSPEDQPLSWIECVQALIPQSQLKSSQSLKEIAVTSKRAILNYLPSTIPKVALASSYCIQLGDLLKLKGSDSLVTIKRVAKKQQLAKKLEKLEAKSLQQFSTVYLDLAFIPQPHVFTSVSIFCPEISEKLVTTLALTPPQQFSGVQKKQHYKLSKKGEWIPKGLIEEDISDVCSVSQADKLLCSFLLKVKKIKPNVKMVLCVPFVSYVHYIALNFRELYRKFVGWMDIYSLAAKKFHDRDPVLKAPFESVSFMKELQLSFLKPSSQLTTGLPAMKKILESLSTPATVEEYVKENLNCFTLSSDTCYLLVFIQADSTIVQSGEEVITAISVYIPDDNCQSAFVPIKPKKQFERFFEKLPNFKKSKNGEWMYVCKSDKARKCKPESDALSYIVSIMKRALAGTNDKALVLLSLVNKGGIALILKSMIENNIDPSIFKLIHGVGNVQTAIELASSRDGRKPLSEKDLEEMHKKLSNNPRFGIFKNGNCKDQAKAAELLLTKKLGEKKRKDEREYAYPLQSPYTNNLLHESKFTAFLNSFDICLAEKFSKSNASAVQVSILVVIKGLLFTESPLHLRPCVSSPLSFNAFIKTVKPSQCFMINVTCDDYIGTLDAGAIIGYGTLPDEKKIHDEIVLSLAEDSLSMELSALQPQQRGKRKSKVPNCHDPCFEETFGKIVLLPTKRPRESVGMKNPSVTKEELPKMTKPFEMNAGTVSLEKGNIPKTQTYLFQSIEKSNEKHNQPPSPNAPSNSNLGSFPEVNKADGNSSEITKSTFDENSVNNNPLAGSTSTISADVETESRFPIDFQEPAGSKSKTDGLDQIFTEVSIPAEISDELALSAGTSNFSSSGEVAILSTNSLVGCSENSSEQVQRKSVSEQSMRYCLPKLDIDWKQLKDQPQFTDYLEKLQMDYETYPEQQFLMELYVGSCICISNSEPSSDVIDKLIAGSIAAAINNSKDLAAFALEMLDLGLCSNSIEYVKAKDLLNHSFDDCAQEFANVLLIYLHIHHPLKSIPDEQALQFKPVILKEDCLILLSEFEPLKEGVNLIQDETLQSASFSCQPSIKTASAAPMQTSSNGATPSVCPAEKQLVQDSIGSACGKSLQSLAKENNEDPILEECQSVEKVMPELSMNIMEDGLIAELRTCPSNLENAVSPSNLENTVSPSNLENAVSLIEEHNESPSLQSRGKQCCLDLTEVRMLTQLCQGSESICFGEVAEVTANGLRIRTQEELFDVLQIQVFYYDSVKVKDCVLCFMFQGMFLILALKSCNTFCDTFGGFIKQKQNKGKVDIGIIKEQKIEIVRRLPVGKIISKKSQEDFPGRYVIVVVQDRDISLVVDHPDLKQPPMEIIEDTNPLMVFMPDYFPSIQVESGFFLSAKQVSIARPKSQQHATEIQNSDLEEFSKFITHYLNQECHKVLSIELTDDDIVRVENICKTKRVFVRIRENGQQLLVCGPRADVVFFESNFKANLITNEGSIVPVCKQEPPLELKREKLFATQSENSVDSVGNDEDLDTCMVVKKLLQDESGHDSSIIVDEDECVAFCTLQELPKPVRTKLSTANDNFHELKIGKFDVNSPFCSPIHLAKTYQILAPEEKEFQVIIGNIGIMVSDVSDVSVFHLLTSQAEIAAEVIHAFLVAESLLLLIVKAKTSTKLCRNTPVGYILTDPTYKFLRRSTQSLPILPTMQMTGEFQLIAQIKNSSFVKDLQGKVYLTAQGLLTQKTINVLPLTPKVQKAIADKLQVFVPDYIVFSSANGMLGAYFEMCLINICSLDYQQLKSSIEEELRPNSRELYPLNEEMVIVDEIAVSQPTQSTASKRMQVKRRKDHHLPVKRSRFQEREEIRVATNKKSSQLCKYYFLHNSCRFGSRCMNLHIVPSHVCINYMRKCCKDQASCSLTHLTLNQAQKEVGDLESQAWRLKSINKRPIHERIGWKVNGSPEYIPTYDVDQSNHNFEEISEDDEDCPEPSNSRNFIEVSSDCE